MKQVLFLAFSLLMAVQRAPVDAVAKTSGVVENKAVRVWSDDADLSVYELSRNPATSDGIYVIPTVGWGKDYVVASYSSLFELSFDYPSEFSIVSAMDNTNVAITPNTDVRASVGLFMVGRAAAHCNEIYRRLRSQRFILSSFGRVRVAKQALHDTQLRLSSTSRLRGNDNNKLNLRYEN